MRIIPMRAALLPLPLAATLAAACADRRPAEPVVTPDSAQVEQARAAATALAGELVQMLSAELGRGGAVSAIAVCADSAQQLTARHQRDGVSVRRVGTRLRNRRNEPDSLERAMLDAFAGALAAGRQPADTALVEQGPNGAPVLRYLRPIRVQEMCLTCHGPSQQMSPDVRQAIAQRYPDDRAVDYAAGDLRGAVSVRLSLKR